MDTEKTDKSAVGMEVPMVDAEVVRNIRQLASFGWGAKRIAAELEVARNTVRSYLRAEGSTDRVARRERPGRRRLCADAVREAVRLFSGC
jgi:hypothetical protein